MQKNRGRKNKNRRTFVPKTFFGVFLTSLITKHPKTRQKIKGKKLRKIEKKCVPSLAPCFLLGFVIAYLGVSQQGESKNATKNLTKFYPAAKKSS
jgi:hypothetical protein